MADPSMIKDFSRLGVHTETVKPLDIETVAEKFNQHEIPGISVWRHTLKNRDINHTGRFLRNHGLSVISLVRGGFFPSVDRSEREKAITENINAIREAQELGAPVIILVCGADPGISLEESKNQIHEGILKILPVAERAGIKLAVEPLHPMYADTRSAIVTLKQANDMMEKIDSDYLGVALDVYHTWWDDSLKNEIQRAGKMNKLFAFHVCDWRVPTKDLLLDRGLMGEGCIDIKQIRQWMEQAGFDGFIEVEIFSKKYWEMDQDEYLEKIKEAYLNHV